MGRNSYFLSAHQHNPNTNMASIFFFFNSLITSSSLLKYILQYCLMFTNLINNFNMAGAAAFPFIAYELVRVNKIVAN